jgi:hypothetical protein
VSTRPPRPAAVLRAGALVLVATLLATALAAFRPFSLARLPHADAILISGYVRDSMDAIWLRSNQHWNELADENTLTQMLGTGKPTQREYLGCMQGGFTGDTLVVTGTVPAYDMKQLQFAVTGSCTGVLGFVGTWHTHPYRAGPNGQALKERGLSAQDLETFAKGHDPAVLVVWDVDSIDAAARTADGTILHPVPVVVH